MSDNPDDWPLKGPLTQLDPDRSPEDIAASIALDEAQAGPSPGLDEFMEDIDPEELPSPRPWRRNPEWPCPGHGLDPAPVLAADGTEVLGTSEWLYVTKADLDLIISAVNAWKD